MILEVYQDNNKIHTLDLNDTLEYSIGKSNTCDIELENRPKISNTHFKIYFKDGNWEIENASQFESLKLNNVFSPRFILKHGLEFDLHPYKFVVIDPQAETNELSALSDVDNSQPQTHFDDITQPDFKFEIPFITIKDGSSKNGKILKLEGKRWIAGRDSTCEIVLADSSASRKHFEIVLLDNKYKITDLDSSNGTLLNGSYLDSNKKYSMKSGDIISVNDISLLFETKNSNFEKEIDKVKRRIQSSTPIIFETQESFKEKQNSSSLSQHQNDNNNNLQPIREDDEYAYIYEEEPNPSKNSITGLIRAICLIAIIGCGGFYYYEQNKPKPKVDNSEESITFAKLSPQNQVKVQSIYKVSKGLYMKGNFELALSQLKKLHNILPAYQDSREIEKFCIQSREIKEQQAYIAKKKKKQKEHEKKLKRIISSCTKKYKDTLEFSEAQSCFSEVLEFDPENLIVQSFLSDIEMRIEEKKDKELIAKEYRDRVATNQRLFNKAKKVEALGNPFETIIAYQKYLKTKYPDPKKLKQVAKDKITSIENSLKEQKESSMKQARTFASTGNLSGAIVSGKKALEASPEDIEITDFIRKHQNTLNNDLKNLYTNSVLEEKYGNLGEAKKLWDAILKIDTPNGEYRRRVNKKLDQYGDF